MREKWGEREMGGEREIEDTLVVLLLFCLIFSSSKLQLADGFARPPLYLKGSDLVSSRLISVSEWVWSLNNFFYLTLPVEGLSDVSG